MKIISVKLPEAYVKKMEQFIKEGRFTSKSELIRYALFDLFRKEEAIKNEREKFFIGP
jgi:Arc/MetJ-type ribon-helix-helix transcriptional regulator